MKEAQVSLTSCSVSSLGWTHPSPGHNGAPLGRVGAVRVGAPLWLDAAGSNMT